MAAHILVVEDHGPTRVAMADLLRDAGYQVTTASGATSAIAAIAQVVPDLVISDVHMRHGGGLDLVTHLRDRGGDRIPILLVSALVEAGHRDAAVALGAVDLLIKPIDVDEVLAHVGRLTRRAAAPS